MPIDGLKTFWFAPGRREKIAKTCIMVYETLLLTRMLQQERELLMLEAGMREGAGIAILSYRLREQSKCLRL